MISDQEKKRNNNRKKNDWENENNRDFFFLFLNTVFNKCITLSAMIFFLSLFLMPSCCYCCTTAVAWWRQQPQQPKKKVRDACGRVRPCRKAVCLLEREREREGGQSSHFFFLAPLTPCLLYEYKYCDHHKWAITPSLCLSLSLYMNVLKCTDMFERNQIFFSFFFFFGGGKSFFSQTCLLSWSEIYASEKEKKRPCFPFQKKKSYGGEESQTSWTPSPPPLPLAIARPCTRFRYFQTSARLSSRLGALHSYRYREIYTHRYHSSYRELLVADLRGC